ncbi:hypothetical protein BROUX41_005332 [Berkeleyomyces rouxiae]
MLTSSPRLSRSATASPGALYYAPSATTTRSPHTVSTAPTLRHSSTKSSTSSSTIAAIAPISTVTTQTASATASTTAASVVDATPALVSAISPPHTTTSTSSSAQNPALNMTPPTHPNHCIQTEQHTMHIPGSSASHSAAFAVLAPTSPLSVSIATTPSATMSPNVLEDRISSRNTTSPYGAIPDNSSSKPRPSILPQQNHQQPQSTISQDTTACSPQKRRGSPSVQEPSHNISTSILVAKQAALPESQSSPRSVSAKRTRPNSVPLKVLPIRYEFCQVEDLVVLISHMLSELIETNDSLALRGSGSLTRFHSRTSPGISVRDYLNRLAKHATLTPPLLLSMVYYIDRLCTLYPDFTINTLTVHRFLITAATVAAKGLSDSFWNNTTYARVGGVRVAELKMLELEFLYRVDWKIVPNPEVLVAYYTGLVERCPGFVLQREGKEKGNAETEVKVKVEVEVDSGISDDATSLPTTSGSAPATGPKLEGNDVATMAATSPSPMDAQTAKPAPCT